MSANHIAKCILNGLGAMKLHITCLSVELYFCVRFFFFIMFGFIEPLNSEKTLWMCNVFHEIVNICCFHLLG